MVCEKVFLLDDNDEVYMDTYISEELPGYQRGAILVIPGGGYSIICDDREGEPIAQAFIPYGYNAFVLHYSVGRKKKFPSQFIEATLALKNIRDNAKEYGIDPNKVFVVGFSAGGHLAGCLGTMWEDEDICKAIEMPYAYNKPTGMILVYPVINGTQEFAKDTESFRDLLCTDTPTFEQLAECSVDLRVTGNTVPTFLFHTANDQCVNVNHTLVMAQALSREQVPFEVHIYPDAPHGVALGNKITACNNSKWDNIAIAKWVEQAAFWADSITEKQA